MERASPRSRLKRAWWKEAKEFEVVLLTSVFLCSVLVLLDLLLCWGWTHGDYHKGDFGDFLTIKWPSTIGTTDLASGFIASERTSLHESWDLG